MVAPNQLSPAGNPLDLHSTHRCSSCATKIVSPRCDPEQHRQWVDVIGRSAFPRPGRCTGSLEEAISSQDHSRISNPACRKCSSKLHRSFVVGVRPFWFSLGSAADQFSDHARHTGAARFCLTCEPAHLLWFESNLCSDHGYILHQLHQRCRTCAGRALLAFCFSRRQNARRWRASRLWGLGCLGLLL